MSSNKAAIVSREQGPKPLYLLSQVARLVFVCYKNILKQYLNYFNVESPVEVYANLVSDNAKPWIEKYIKNNPSLSSSAKIKSRNK